MEIFIKIAQLVLSLSLLIFVHEMGHYLFSRLFKIRVDKFYVFINPSFSVLRAKRINKKWQLSWFSPKPPEAWKEHADKTEWGIGWLPLGGYCKIAGMIDESMDKEQMKQPPQSWEFRTKPVWQRMFVMIGGVMFNVFLALLIYWGMLFTWGEKYLTNKDVIYGVQCDSIAQSLGFRNGDKILFFDGRPVDRFFELKVDTEQMEEPSLQMEMFRNQVREVTVDRNGETVAIPLGEHNITTMMSSLLFYPRIPFVVATISDTSHNANSELRVGDRVVGIDSLPLCSVQDVQKELQRHKGETIAMQVNRKDSLTILNIAVNENGIIGVGLSTQLSDFFPITQKKYTIFKALPAGIAKGGKKLKEYVKELKLMLTPKTEAYKQVGSFITITKFFPSHWNWYGFWKISAWLSIMLAVVNILPIPGLDGGHLMFVLYEMIARRKPSEKVYEMAQWIGFVLLIGLMIFAFGNDIIRTFF